MGFSVEVQADVAELNALLGRARGATSNAVKYTALDVWSNIRREAPVDHGRLAGSFELNQMNEFGWKIFTNVHYALYVHEGTGIHGPAGQMIEILPRRAKALYWKGAPHPVRRVLSPGQKPNPYVDRALETTSGRLDDFIRKAIEEIK